MVKLHDALRQSLPASRDGSLRNSASGVARGRDLFAADQLLIWLPEQANYGRK